MATTNTVPYKPVPVAGAQPSKYFDANGKPMSDAEYRQFAGAPQGQTMDQQLGNSNLVDLRGKTNASGSGAGGTVGNSWKPAPAAQAPSFFDGPSNAPAPGTFTQSAYNPVQMKAQPFAGSPIPSVGSQGQPWLQSTATQGSYAPGIQTSIGGGTFATNTGTQIDPNNSLRSQQFLPGATQNPYDQQAYQALQGATMPTEFSPMVGESRDMIMDRLRGLSGPDRTQLATEAYDIFRQQSEPQYQQDLRGVGQKAAALGRVGAGMTTNDLTGVLGQREQQQNLLQRSLINDAAGQTLQDRLNTLNATLGGSSTLEGQDFNRQQAGVNNSFSRAGILQGMGQDEFGRQQSNYNQNANERAYQDYLARTAVEDRIRQQEMQQNQAQQEWERQNAANQLAAQIAMGQNTSYPSVGQPQGDSFGAGQVAGAQAPTYSDPYANTSQPFIQPPSMFDDNAGLGLQDPNNRNFQVEPDSIFRNQRFGLAM